VSAEQSPLALAAQRKSESAITRVRTALGAMHDAAVDITFQSVAQQAGVSRQWLYKNAELRAEVEKLRARQQGGRRIPVSQRISEASLQQRNLTLLEENKRLRRENSELREELAKLIGERRAQPRPASERRGA
jgi:regulator of replication initiation timing